MLVFKEKNSGRPAVFNKEMSDELYENFTRVRALGAPVRREEIQAWACRIADRNNISTFLLPFTDF